MKPECSKHYVSVGEEQMVRMQSLRDRNDIKAAQNVSKDNKKTLRGGDWETEGVLFCLCLSWNLRKITKNSLKRKAFNGSHDGTAFLKKSKISKGGG